MKDLPKAKQVSRIDSHGRGRALPPLRNLLRCLQAGRILEVLLIMGAPLLALLFAMPGLDAASFGRGAVVLAATFVLALHVYFFNAWAGREQDRFDSNKRAWPSVAGAVSPRRLLVLSLLSLAAATLIFLAISPWLVGLSFSIAILWIAYAHPAIALKGIAVVPTFLHLVAGVLTTLLAQGAYALPDRNGILRGIYFGMVLSGGHLIHELLDRDADDKAGFRTSAIRFGAAPVFLASFLLFTASTVFFCILPKLGAVPPGAASALVLIYPLYCWFCTVAYRSGLSHGALADLRGRYRSLYVLAGIVMAAAAIYSHLH